MSLASQSQQWYPTSLQVTVFQARNLRIKGKNGTNDAYAIIQMAKDKFSTSVVEKCVSPVWKEEATFDLPLFHRGNADRCTLYIIVMHRALVGLDKLLGQAVINLLELHENKSRNKTEWFKLVDKNGKADKDRGEVLLDIQFMRNNITASMFDLSMQEKPRSHIGKLKDKIRGKKSGFSDSASAIVPSVTQVMTDSEEDADAHAEPSGAKKKSKIKSLFGPKSNLQRNVSQSMSTLGTLPEKNSALSGSRSSGLNVDSPEAKKKFKFLTHKRTDSSDSRTSLGPFSLLNRSKQNVVEQSGVCINGSHVYTEETEPKSSTLSLPSSSQGSTEDVRPVLGRNPSDVSVDSLKGLSLPSYRAESRQKTQLEDERQQAERVQEERARLEEQQRRREEQDKRKLEEERRKLEEQQKKQQQEEEEERRKQEEARRAEERKRQEDLKKSVEASTREEPTVTNRLSSLFGIGRKKEEHSTASQEEKHGVEEPPPAGSTTPFEEIPLSPEPANPFDESSQQASQSLHNSTGFSNRTAKVYPVKPRFVAESIQGTPPSPSADPYIESHLPSSSTPNSTNPTVPSESTDMFSTLHSSLAPPNARRSSSDSLSSINENLNTESHRPSISQKRQAPLPPGQKASAKHEVSPSVHSGNSQSTEAGKPKAAPRSLSSKTAATSGYLNPIAEVSDSREKESSAFQRDKQPPLPLPDYDELFPKRRHGILGQVKWDMVISEVNLKQKKNKADIDQHEMSIDGPDLSSESIQVQDEKPDIFSRMTESQDQEEPFPVWKRRPITNKQPVVPPKPKVVTPPGEIPKMVGSVTEKPNPFASKVFLAATPKVQNTDAPQVKSRILLQCETKVQNTDVDVGKRKDNSPKDMQNSTVVGKDVVSPGDRKTSFKSYEDSLPVKPRQSSLNRAPISNVSNQETLGSMVTQKPQNEAKDTKVLEKVSGTGEINEVSMTTNNTDLFSGNISLKTPTVTKPDLEEKAVQSPAKQLVVESDPFLNNSFLSKDLLVGKNAESQGDANTPLKGTKESPPVKPRQSPLNSAPIGNFPVHEKLGSMVTQKPQNEAKDTEMLEEVSGSEEIIEGSMTMAQDADLFSDAFVKTNVSKPDSKEKAVANSPVKEQVVELDSFPNDLFLSKDPVLVKDAESQGDTKTHLKSTKESPPVKPRQSSRIIAPVRTTPVQEKLGSMVTQKPQNEAKDTKMLEEVSGSEEIIEGSMTMAQDADLFSDAFVKTNVSKPDSKEKAVANSPVKEQVVELDSFPNDLFLSKDPVLVKDAESQGDTKTHLKSTKESRPVKPRQSSRIIAPVRTTPVQEKLGSMVTQKPQNEAKDSKILEKVSGSEEINEESTALTKGTDLFSDGIFVKINVSKPDCEEKAEGSPAKWRIVEPDPFPNDVFLSKDPWALPLESKNKSEQIMSEEDLEKIFSSNIVDPFTGFVHNVSAKSPEPKIEMTVKTNPELSSGTQSNLFTKKKKAPPLPVNAANADKITTEHLFKRKPMVTMSTGEPKMETHIQNLDRPAKTDSAVFQSKKTVVAADPIPSASSPVSSSLTSPEPQMSATEEGTAHRGVTSGGKTLLRAWVTPSESQSVSVQSSSGGGAIGKMGEPASSLRRPHPVKPLGSESLISSSTLQGRDSKPTETHEPVLRKPKVTASESGPYSQLTQEELITLVVKQQAEISKKDAKILELEEYIDNLLVRVIDEKPSILMSMPTSKKAF